MAAAIRSGAHGAPVETGRPLADPTVRYPEPDGINAVAAWRPGYGGGAAWTGDIRCYVRRLSVAGRETWDCLTLDHTLAQERSTQSLKVEEGDEDAVRTSLDRAASDPDTIGTAELPLDAAIAGWCVPGGPTRRYDATEKRPALPDRAPASL